MINLFEENSYIKEFRSKIKKIDKENKIIELENTAFYGKGGGQPGDTGILKIKSKKIEVLETIKKENSILHLVNSIDNIEIENEVKGSIDWGKRYKFMRMHTALHILCATVPLGVTGGQIGVEKSRLDFNGDSNNINKEILQEKLNAILNYNHEITSKWIESDELEKKPELIKTMGVKPPKKNGKIRLVKIGNIDMQACGGTHVKNTSEIGMILIGKIENKGKMNRRINISLND
jgi:misacylated tRNA(Ala) deacylase